MEVGDIASTSFDTTIACSGLESDAHPAAHLLDKAGPFVAERFIKPPMELRLGFKERRKILGVLLHLKVSVRES